MKLEIKQSDISHRGDNSEDLALRFGHDSTRYVIEMHAKHGLHAWSKPSHHLYKPHFKAAVMALLLSYRYVEGKTQKKKHGRIDETPDHLPQELFDDIVAVLARRHTVECSRYM